MPIIILIILPILCIVVYFFSVRSRKSYRCPQCGESITNVEYLQAKRCGLCGAPLEITEEN